jgi:hypothetical protein
VQRIRLTSTDSNEIQHIEITEKRHTQKLSFAGLTKDANNYTLSGGEFRLTYFNEAARTYSNCLDYTISATNLDIAIETLTGINDVTVTSSGSFETNDKEFTVVFPTVSTPFALSIDKLASYPEFTVGSNPGRDGTFACKRANSLSGEFISIDIPGGESNSALECSDTNLPLVGSYGQHNLNSGDVILLSYNDADLVGATQGVGLHKYMFIVGVTNATHFTISSNFSGTANSQFGKRSTLGPTNSVLITSRGSWIRILQPSIITSISSGRINTGNDYDEQVVTTRTPHGYESGDIIQLSLHYQPNYAASIGGINAYNPNPVAESWRMKSIYSGMMHSNIFEVEKKTDTTFSLHRCEYIKDIGPGSTANTIRFYFTADFGRGGTEYIPNGGQIIEIECYECGVTGFDENTYTVTASASSSTLAYIQVDNTYNINYTTYTNYSFNYATLKFKTSHNVNTGFLNTRDLAQNGLGFAGIVVPRRRIVAENLGGSFTLNLDTSGVPPVSPWKCRVCAVHENTVSSQINPTQSINSQTDSLHYLLSALNNVKSGNITTEYIRSKPGRTQSEGVLYKITFSGNQVNGDIPLLVVSSTALTGDQATISVKEHYKGHQVRESNKVSFEGETTLAIDVGVCPMASNPNSDYATDCQQSKSVGDRIQALSTVASVEVSRIDYNDGAGGLDYLVTFTGDDGNLEPLAGIAFDLYPNSTSQIVVSKVTDGNFVGGIFSVSLASKTRRINNVSVGSATAVVTSFAHGFIDGDYVRITCGTCSQSSQIDDLNWKVSAATTNTFTPVLINGNNVNSTSYPVFSGLASAEKVVTIKSISASDYAQVITHGDHGFTNATHLKKYVAFFDLTQATQLDNTK